LAYVFPVHNVPKSLHIVGFDVHVVEIEGVLPHIELKEGDRALRAVALLVKQLLDDELRSHRVPRQDAPAGSLDTHGSRSEVGLEGVKGTKELANGCGNFTLG